MDVSVKGVSSSAQTGLRSDSENKHRNIPAISLTQPDLLDEKDSSELSVSDAALVKAIEKAQKMINGTPRKFEYEIYHDNVVVKVINAETDEVIREIPPEKFIDLVDKLIEISGMIIDEKR